MSGVFFILLLQTRTLETNHLKKLFCWVLKRERKFLTYFKTNNMIFFFKLDHCFVERTAAVFFEICNLLKSKDMIMKFCECCKSFYGFFFENYSQDYYKTIPNLLLEVSYTIHSNNIFIFSLQVWKYFLKFKIG